MLDKLPRGATSPSCTRWPVTDEQSSCGTFVCHCNHSAWHGTAVDLGKRNYGLLPSPNKARWRLALLFQYGIFIRNNSQWSMSTARFGECCILFTAWDSPPHKHKHKISHKDLDSDISWHHVTITTYYVVTILLKGVLFGMCKRFQSSMKPIPVISYFCVLL